MNFNLKKIELEITNNCNAACPGCTRTQNLNLIKNNSFTYADFKSIFSNHDYTGTEFKFCGVLGDPAMNEDCADMVEHVLKLGGRCEISTNGGVQPASWWEKLGNIASTYPGLLDVHFCIDGHATTNHIYRINTKWSVIERNIESYAKTAPINHATWVYILFDHNEADLEKAKNHAKQLGFKFALRTGMRNSYYTWISKANPKKNNSNVNITTTGIKEHSKVNIVKELDKFIEDYKNNNVDENEKIKILNSIVCKYVHEDEIFIANDLTMWPCCFLWDAAFKDRENIIKKLNVFEPDWNSLRYHSIEEIRNHPWFKNLLKESWDPAHFLHFNRCIKTCAKNKAYHNEINYIDN